jgi:hypothetical protein
LRLPLNSQGKSCPHIYTTIDTEGYIIDEAIKMIVSIGKVTTEGVGDRLLPEN